MFHKAPDGHRGVDVKLLAELGYLAERLRNHEQRWELAELKDLHKRIVLSFDELPLNVVQASVDDQLRPVQSELHGRSQLQQEVERAAEAAQKVEATKRQQRLQRIQQSTQPSPCDDVDHAKLVQLEDFLISFYHSYSETHKSTPKCKKTKKSRNAGAKDKVFPFLPSSSSRSSSLASSSSSTEAGPRPEQCDSQCATATANDDKQPKQLHPEQSFTTSQADRTMNQDREPGDPNSVVVEPAQATDKPTSTTTNDDNSERDRKSVV